MEASNMSIWEQMACRYDTSERVENAKIIVQAVRTQLKNTQDKTALDYGCGTGLIGLGCIDLFASMIFVDASAQMIEQVNQKIQKGHLQAASTLCCDFLTEAPPDVQVDYILLSQVLLHIKDSHFILSQLYKLLKAGGHLIIVDFDTNAAVASDKVHNGFDQKELSTLLTQVGFSSSQARTFYHGEKIFMNQDASLFILDAVR